MKTIFSILILSFIGFVGCQQEDYSPMLSKAERLMNERPDSALQLLRNFRIDNIHGRANKAKYALLYSQALDKNYIDLTNDSLIRIAVDYYQRKGSKTQRAWSVFYHARIFENAGDTDTAMNLFLEAETFAEETNEHYLKGMIYNRKANLYTEQYDYDNAILMYLKSTDCYAKINCQCNEMYVYGGLARTFSLKNDLNKTLQYLGKAQQLAVVLKDTCAIVRYTAYYASSLLKEIQNPQASLDMLKRAYSSYLNDIPPVDNYPLLCELYLKLNNLTQAQDYALKFYNQQNLSAKEKIDILSLLIDIARTSKNYINWDTYNTEYTKLKDSLANANYEHFLYKIEQKYNNQKLVAANASLTKENKLYRVIIGLSICLLVIVVGVVWYILKCRNDQIQYYRKSVDILRKQYVGLQQMKNELSHDNAFLQTVLDDKIDMIKEIIELVGSHREDSEKFLSKFKEYVKADEKHSLSVVFRDIIESRQPGILAYLQVCHPDLNDDDIDLYCQICGGCSIDVLCLVSNHSPKYIYNKRTVLRRKLMQQEDEKRTLLEHLAQLIEEYRQKHITSDLSS